MYYHPHWLGPRETSEATYCCPLSPVYQLGSPLVEVHMQVCTRPFLFCRGKGPLCADSLLGAWLAGRVQPRF